MAVHRRERDPKRESSQHSERRRCGKSRQPGIGDVGGHADKDIFCKRHGDLVVEEVAQTPPLGVDPTQELTFIEPERDRVVRLSRSGLPRWLLPGEHERETIQIGDQVAIDRLVKGKQSGLVAEQLPDNDLLLALLSELGPVRRHPLVIIQPPTRMSQRERHRSQTFCG